MEKTVNLGVLFNQAKKGQPISRSKKYTKKLKNSKKKEKKATGISRVNKVHSFNYKQGFYFRYTYKDDNDKYKVLQSKSLKALYDKMIAANHTFEIFDVKKARNFISDNCSDEDYDFFLNTLFLNDKLR